MKVNIIFESVKIYDVGDRLDVVVGQAFGIEVLEAEPMPEIFTNRDPILEIDNDGIHANALALGESIIRFMDGVTVVKDLTIAVVEATSPNATTLGGILGDPVPK